MTTVISKILIANRGEIAVRIIRTCRAMGIATVAVYSDADADATHVAMADEAVRIGPPAPTESYLDIDKILSATALSGADAIHPGYGFLAENAEFARACEQAGVTFIGPSAEVIGLLGSKRESKRVVTAAGVPVIPGYNGIEQDEATLIAEAEKLGFPILLKASAGGGGKGMRVVRAAGELPAAIAGAKREARRAFADDTLLIETYVDRPRHVEIQIIGDSHGQIVHLFERECSIQRRHQKIVEETPSTALDAALRAEMGAAAVTIGEAVGYVNAGTVEFIVAPDGRFYFLEVNTRLQVEHPITEAITGLDLVCEQIRVARGEPLSTAVTEARMDGAAIECRLYAEDADHGFLPTTGTLLDFDVPDHVVGATGLRIDTGVDAGTSVSIHYDPMLAKLVCHGPSRADTVHKMLYCLRALSVHGVTTNRDFLVRVLSHPGFLAGATHTHFLAEHATDLGPEPPAPELVQTAALAAALHDHEARRQDRAVLPALEPGFRNNRFRDERVVFDLVTQVDRSGDEDARSVAVEYRNLGARRFQTAVQMSTGDAGDESLAAVGVVQVVSFAERELIIEVESGWRQRLRVIRDGAMCYVQSRTRKRAGVVALRAQPRFPDAASARVEGGCVAPMPGKVVKLLVSEGQSVNAGDTLVVLEAMKMEHTVKAPADGVVTRLPVAEGEQVDSDALLVIVDPRSE